MSTTTGNMTDDTRSDSTLTPLKQLDQNMQVRPVHQKVSAKVLKEMMGDRNSEEFRPCSVKFQDEQPDLGYEVSVQKFFDGCEAMATKIQNLKQEHENSEEQYKKQIQNLKQERESSDEHFKKRIEELEETLQELLPPLNLMLGSQPTEEDLVDIQEPATTTSQVVAVEPTATTALRAPTLASIPEEDKDSVDIP